MAMTDYFINFTKVTLTETSDGLGSYTTTKTDGATIKGLAVRKRINEKVVGAEKQNSIGYTFHTSENVSRGDILKFTEAGVIKYIRITSDALTNTELSAQTGWKSWEAVEYE